MILFTGRDRNTAKVGPSQNTRTTSKSHRGWVSGTACILFEFSGRIHYGCVVVWVHILSVLGLCAAEVGDIEC